MEVVELADRTEAGETGAEVLVVARGQHPATALAEAHDPRCVARREPVAGVHGHQPELVVVEFVEPAQHRIVACACSVTCGDVVARGPQFIGQQREAGDLPVVGTRRDGRLQENS